MYEGKIKVNNVNFELFTPLLQKGNKESIDLYFNILENYQF